MSFFKRVPSVYDTDGEYADTYTGAFVPVKDPAQEEQSDETEEKP